MSVSPVDLRDRTLSADAVRNALAMQALPEGGAFREIWRDKSSGVRGSASTTLFLLAEGEKAHWHRIDVPEIWLWHAGAPLELTIVGPNSLLETHTLGPDLSLGERLQVIVPAFSWQEARSQGEWSLVANVASPAFEFNGLEVAPPDWHPAEATD